MWVRREKERELQAAGKADLPWPLYLVFSVLVSIASVSASATATFKLLWQCFTVDTQALLVDAPASVPCSVCWCPSHQ